MAEQYKGRVIRMTFGGGDVDDIRVFERLLASIDRIGGFVVDAGACELVAFADDSSDAENDIIRAMLASGMYPIASNASDTDGHGRLAC